MNFTTWINSEHISSIQRTRYHSRQPVANYTTPEEVLASAQTKPVLSNMERHFTCDLVVPDMIAPNLNNCSIIDVGYFFKVTYCFLLFHRLSL